MESLPIELIGAGGGITVSAAFMIWVVRSLTRIETKVEGLSEMRFELKEHDRAIITHGLKIAENTKDIDAAHNRIREVSPHI